MNENQTAEANLARGKQMAEEVISAVGGALSPWVPSGPGIIGLWEYADLTFAETVLRIGVSGGGVVAVNGHPFDPDGQVNLTPEAVGKSLRDKFVQIFARRLAVVLTSAGSFLKPEGSSRAHADINLSLEDLEGLGIGQDAIKKALPYSCQMFPSAMAYAEFVERTHLFLLQQYGDDFWESDIHIALGWLVYWLMKEGGLDPEDDGGYCCKATADEICLFNLSRMATYLSDPSASYPARNPSAKQAEVAGYRVELGGEADSELAGRWWWTLCRPGMDVESSEGDFPTEGEAWTDAVRAHRSE